MCCCADASADARAMATSATVALSNDTTNGASGRPPPPPPPWPRPTPPSRRASAANARSRAARSVRLCPSRATPSWSLSMPSNCTELQYPVEHPVPIELISKRLCHALCLFDGLLCGLATLFGGGLWCRSVYTRPRSSPSTRPRSHTSTRARARTSSSTSSTREIHQDRRGAPGIIVLRRFGWRLDVHDEPVGRWVPITGMSPICEREKC